MLRLLVNRYLFYIFALVLFSNLNAEELKYKIINIYECKIPIPINYKETRKYKKNNEYNFSEIKIIDDKTFISNWIRISNRKDGDYQDILNSVKKTQRKDSDIKVKIIKNYIYKNFTVIIRKVINKEKYLGTYYTYSLLGEKTKFFIAGDTVGMDYINYMLDYCDKHRNR